MEQVVAGVFFRDGKVLMFEKKGRGFEFPGGKTKPGESPREALHRELKEELAVDARPGEFLAAAVDERYEVLAYRIDAWTGIFQLREHGKMMEVNQEDIRSLPLCPLDKILAEAVFREESLSLDTPLGRMVVRGNHANVTAADWSEEPVTGKPTEPLLKAKEQLTEYFQGTRKDFTFALFLEGTDFQKDIWEKTRRIPYGCTRSYGEISHAPRAAGNALHNNRHLILVPCHRVVAKGGLGGFGNDLSVKVYLLELEKKV
ncbi:MAG: methylated-DNA--[protein]-cysteine S-methyltransferase [Clostridia bacterium]